MKLEKIKKTFNDYKLELSWGQVEAIAAALQANHSDPLADELNAEWQWYMQRVPGPGEDEEEIEAQQKAAEGGGMAGEGGEGGEDDLPIPMPPGTEAGTPPTGGKQPTYPPDEDASAGPTPAAVKLGAPPKGAPPKGEVGLPEMGDADMEITADPEGRGGTDRRLPEPPLE